MEVVFEASKTLLRSIHLIGQSFGICQFVDFTDVSGATALGYAVACEGDAHLSMAEGIHLEVIHLAR